MDTFITLSPIVMAIASGLWVSHRRKNKAPWIRTWLKAIAVLAGIPVAAYCIFMALGLTDADVKWILAPLSFMLFNGVASVVGVFGYNIFSIVNTKNNLIKRKVNSKHSERSHNPDYHNDHYNYWGIIYASDYAVANDERREEYNRANIYMYDEYDDDN